MVSKRLKGNYLRSYEKVRYSRYLHQRTGTTFDGFTNGFLVEQKNQKYDQKIRYLPQKVQKYGKSKTGVKTAQRPLFKELRTILEKIGFQVLFCFLFVFFFLSYPIMLPSGPSDSAFTQRGPKARVLRKEWVDGNKSIPQFN